MVTLRSGILVMITGVLIASLFCFVCADDDVIYPGGMVMPSFNTSMIGTMHGAEAFNTSMIGTMKPKSFNSSEIPSMHPAEAFNSSMIGTMQKAKSFNSSEIATMQKTNSSIPLPKGVSV